MKKVEEFIVGIVMFLLLPFVVIAIKLAALFKDEKLNEFLPEAVDIQMKGELTEEEARKFFFKMVKNLLGWILAIVGLILLWIKLCPF